MKTIRFILILTLSISCVNSCFSQRDKIGIDKEFIMFLNKFKTVKPPLNYKKTGTWGKDMTEKEAVKFLNLTELELYPIIKEVGEDDEENYYKEENMPGCKLKYQLNDSVYILCILTSILESNNNMTFASLYSFTPKGKIIENLLCKQDGINEQGLNNLTNFVLLDKTHVRVFYYVDNNARIKEGFRSTVYYVNYEITNDGKFVEKDKSNIMWLKNWANNYSTYKPQSDDPMNEYE